MTKQERIVAASYFLHQKGYVILRSGVSFRGGNELDIIAYRDNVVHYINVCSVNLNVSDSQPEGYSRTQPEFMARTVGMYKDEFHDTASRTSIDRIIIAYRSQDDYYMQLFEHIDI